jgi:hypothetical protein
VEERQLAVSNAVDALVLVDEVLQAGTVDVGDEGRQAPQPVEHIETAVISGLALVSVTAQRGDNVHRIFESLNNTGLRLTQGDLLRNYLFMRLPARGETVYHSLWLPLQEMLSSPELELLFWLDLVQRDPRVKQTDTYTAQQARLDRLASEDGIEAEIARFGRLGALLRTVLNPAREPHAEVRLRLERLMAWEQRPSTPLLLHLLDRRDQGRASSEEIGRAMLYVESFFVVTIRKSRGPIRVCPDRRGQARSQPHDFRIGSDRGRDGRPGI